MRRVILASVVGLLLLGTEGSAQQLPQFTQYMFNPYVINPAIGGTHGYYQIRLNNRFQWVGLTDAPQSYNISFFGPHAKKDMGFGANVYYDVTGATSRTGGLFSYSYNIQVTSSGLRLSGAVSAGFLMYRADGSKFEFGEGFVLPDPAIYNSAKSIFTPDASVGLYLYNYQFYVSLATHQLIGQRLYRSVLTDSEGKDYYGINRLKQHFMLGGGVFLKINRDIELEPSALIKYMISSPIQLDLNAKITYRKEFWGGLSFRWQDGLSILFGYNYDKRYLFGYSFDYSLTGIRKHNSGSHEIMIGYLFDKIK
jgi:type IX secretion system PorP/SprF family membrane protein